jgi:hypothetical protein
MSLADDALDKLNEIIELVQELLLRKIPGTSVSVSEGLSDISERLGLVRAGEFRSGNSQSPGFGFTGVRMGYPAFTYGGQDYHIVGLSDDVLQFGLSATDGTALAGAGAIRLTEDGIEVFNGLTQTGKWDDDGDFSVGEDIDTPAKAAFHVFAEAQTYNSESVGAGDILIGDNSSGKPNLFWDASIPQLKIRSGTVETGYLSGSSFISGAGVRLTLSPSDTPQTITTATPTDIEFAAEEFDDSGFSDLGVSDTDITIQVAGRYFVNINVAWDANSTGIRSAAVYKNGGAYWPAHYGGPAPGGITTQSATDIRYFDVDDVLTLRVTHTKGSDLNVHSASITVRRER